MSNAKRPALNKAASKAEKERQALLDDGVRLTLDEGKTWYTLRVGDVTPELARELRQTTGRGFMELTNMLGNSPDLDVVQEAVWFARRVKGEKVALEDITLDYGVLLSDEFDIETAGPSEADASPEA